MYGFPGERGEPGEPGSAAVSGAVKKKAASDTATGAAAAAAAAGFFLGLVLVLGAGLGLPCLPRMAAAWDLDSSAATLDIVLQLALLAPAVAGPEPAAARHTAGSFTRLGVGHRARLGLLFFVGPLLLGGTQLAAVEHLLGGWHGACVEDDGQKHRYKKPLHRSLRACTDDCGSTSLSPDRTFRHGER